MKQLKRPRDPDPGQKTRHFLTENGGVSRLLGSLAAFRRSVAEAETGLVVRRVCADNPSDANILGLGIELLDLGRGCAKAHEAACGPLALKA